MDNTWRKGRACRQGLALNTEKCNPRRTEARIKAHSKSSTSTRPACQQHRTVIGFELPMGRVGIDHGATMVNQESDYMEGTHFSLVKVDSDDGILPLN